MEKQTRKIPFYIAKILYDYTDYENSLSTTQIADILEKEYGIKSYRTTISDNISLLKEIGMDIQTIKSRQNKYNLLSRYFDDIELKLLIDAVESSKFISKTQSKNLVSKISMLAGKNAARKLKRNISVERRIKSNNENVINIADTINEAINQGKQICFQYFEYNKNKERVPRYNGYWYNFSPYRLVWNGEFYYMVGYYEKYDCITSFRIDRIVGTPKITEIKSKAKPDNFDLDTYLNTMYHMFSTKRENIELICQNNVMDSIIDRFGDTVQTYEYDDENFLIDVEVAVNNVFYSWIFGFGGLVKIKSPNDVKEQYNNMVLEAAKILK